MFSACAGVSSIASHTLAKRFLLIDLAPSTDPGSAATFRPAAVNTVQVPGHRRLIGRRPVRAFTALLLAACIGVAAIAWQSYVAAAKQIIARWAPQPVLTSSPLLDELIAVSLRAETRVAFEGAAKIRRVRKLQPVCDIVDAFLFSRQQLARAVEAESAEILIGRLAGGGLEGSYEMIAAQAGCIRNVRKRWRLLDAAREKIQHSREALRIQSPR